MVAVVQCIGLDLQSIEGYCEGQGNGLRRLLILYCLLTADSSPRSSNKISKNFLFEDTPLFLGRNS